MALGALLARMPDLQVALQVDKSQLGLTLIGMAIGALISLTVSSPLIERLGPKVTAYITVIGTAACYALVPWMPGAAGVFAVLLVAGMLAGALEINLNVELGRIEAATGRSVMNRAHGCWSAGFFVTALVASFARQSGMSMQAHLGAAFLVVIVFAWIAIRGLEAAPVDASHLPEEKAPAFAFPTMGLLPLCLIGIAAFLVEGAGIDWSAIYMRDVFQSEPFVGGLGLTLFTFFMALVRMVADPIVERFGSRAVAASLLVLSAIGIAAVGLSPHPVVALVGFALMGAGCSAVYPLAVSAAAQRRDRAPHVNVASLGQVTFIIFFFAPPLLGFVAEHAGIRASYFICLPLVVGALFCVPALKSVAPRTA
ncbi:MFS transporter [Rhizobium sp. Leaf371]|uniref:MFS transporter n=1 Tax=Rhizobium sp. Leaf371 TaxID=1736355 RepID=UPI0012E9162B|nr:MFS transporter [Rhizobium sp. Leaf371]